MTDPALIIGLGNELRGDDGAGPLVAAILRKRGVDALAYQGEPIDLLDTIQGRDRVIVVDAVAGSRPGRIWRLSANDGELPAAFAERSSTHLFGLAEVVELARPLGLMPARLELIGIEGREFALGTAPSPPVATAAGHVAAAIIAELRGGIEIEQEVVG